MTEAFPNIDNVKIKVQRPGNLELKTVVPAELKRIIRDEVTSSSSDSFMKTPGIVFRTPLHRRELFGGVTFEKGIPKNLFDTPIQQYASIVDHPNLISERLKALVEANEILSRSGRNVERTLSIIKTGILELPTSWGSWARGFIDGRGRYVAFIQYYNEDRLNCAFEIENKQGKESFAIGVLNKTNNDSFNIHDFSCVMDHCRRRVYLRGKNRKPQDAYCGIWPTGIEYADVIGKKINHSEKRKHPYFLATDLLDKGIKKVEN